MRILVDSLSDMRRGNPAWRGAPNGMRPSPRPSPSGRGGRRCASRPRAATTLVETIVAMTAGAVIVVLGITTIHLLLGTERELTRSVRSTASVSRLSRVFRDDVHAAKRVELEPAAAGGNPALIATVAPDHVVRYEIDAHRVGRLESLPEGPHRDVFYFPPQSALQFERDDAAGVVRLTLAMPTESGRPGKSPESTSRLRTLVMAIEAVPARDHRFTERAP